MACSSAAIVATACIIVPPPDVPQEPDEPPRIVSVQPFTSPPLLVVPDEFMVGVDPEWPENPTAPPAYYVLVDPGASQASPAIAPAIANYPPAMAPNEAGVSLITFPSAPLMLDAGACHTVVLVVARTFNTSYVATMPGPATVTWNYAGPNAPYGCLSTLLDGQPPPPDAADGPFIPPSEGGGPDP
jgi:hypothetical protein